ncbi:hypothetical protein [Pseudomonas syringae group genomosp. 3]|uniref:hypothetical protein n=1 Tax=Pseudomonas syringae group genomosp. 3 TaxID=251701 RepID=UPI0011C34C8C|nr:hypothetical protein [Pseudomonas syringae group genomosp. 3]
MAYRQQKKHKTCQVIAWSIPGAGTGHTTLDIHRSPISIAAFILVTGEALHPAFFVRSPLTDN